MSTAPTPPDETPPAEPAEAPAAPAGRRWFRRTAAPAPVDPPPLVVEEEITEVVPPPPRVEPPRELRRTRKSLVTEREDTVYHLGGLAFELYRRDLLPHEAMRLRAGRVAEIDETIRDIDARLEHVERERRERRRRTVIVDADAGCCLICRTPFRAAARFCSHCGARLVPDGPGDEQPTAAITIPPA